MCLTAHILLALIREEAYPNTNMSGMEVWLEMKRKGCSFLGRKGRSPAPHPSRAGLLLGVGSPLLPASPRTWARPSSLHFMCTWRCPIQESSAWPPLIVNGSTEENIWKCNPAHLRHETFPFPSYIAYEMHDINVSSLGLSADYW